MVVTQSTVVILSSRSLFVEGIAARLRRNLGDALLTVDAQDTEALAKVITAGPRAVLLDASDPDVTRHCPLSKLLNALPSLTIIRLDPQHDHIQVVTSEQREAGDVQDLIEVIKSANKER